MYIYIYIYSQTPEIKIQKSTEDNWMSEACVARKYIRY